MSDVENPHKLKKQMPIRIQDGHGGRLLCMEEVFMFLNNLGDDWWYGRRERVENISGGPTFMCTVLYM
jgi:hypothetical protein